MRQSVPRSGEGMGERVAFERLAAPLQVGPVTLPNRVVFPAHLTNFAVDGLPTARHAAYYAARAAGGAGLVVTEESTVDPADRPYEKLVRGYDPAVLPGYRLVTDAVHAHGTPVFAQLNHNGGQSDGTYTRAPVVAPSAVPDPLFRAVPREATAADVARLVAGYADVAARCAAGGFDGVEVQGSQSSLVRQFLSRATNRRTDGYGGPLEHRARFLVEVLGAVREAVGPGLAVGVRLAGEEGVADGTTLAEAAATARLLADRGLVDYVSTTVGVATATLERVIPPMTTPPGYARHVPAAIRAAVGVPVVGVGRYLDPAQAERALADGDCDMVGLARGQIADPEFAAKALGGRAGEIRTCLGCNQECAGAVGTNRSLGCVTNPRAGREAPLEPPVRRRRVLVVGGGPAGLRAAATAAQRGHAVTVLEERPETGGAVRVAASAPGRGGLRPLADDLAAECARAGVEVRTGVRATADLVRAQAADVVVLATGARAARPAWAGESGRVVDVREVLGGAVAPAGAVLVVDDLGSAAAPSVAELLAARGCAVEVVTAAMVVGQDLGLTLDRPRWQRRAAELGIRQSTDLLVEAVEGRVVRLRHHPTGAVQRRTVDWVVVAAPGEPADELWRELRDSGLEVHRIGDCLAPRRASAATLDGDRLGALL
ncbi:mycofactocin system FadH/OYE family oxidoreductase 2 [Geodermatophilus sp. CPCC 206100]|uniref:mycofactocin system FadH/OYE family oxidoreductase 2 n=1 Tax=Geodermatophilus sp. CPCC 206100 TaxID=3020054 RepID=UPI003B0043A4